ncbi:MAG: hypothetical protein ACJ8LG_09280 [Massilia sp.]
MTRTVPPRSPLLAPLVYLAALVLLLEEWFWEAGSLLASVIGRWPPLRALERRIAGLRPYPALCLFVLPGLLLLPLKVLALLAIAHGHALAGIAVIVLAKLGGAAVVARVYVLTLPALRSLAWFARWHSRFIAARDRLLGRLRASRSFRRARRAVHVLRHGTRRLLRRLRPPMPSGSRHSRPWARVLRRFVGLWRARRRPSPQSEHR